MTLTEFLQHLGTKPEWGGAGAASAGSRAPTGDTPLPLRQPGVPIEDPATAV